MNFEIKTAVTIPFQRVDDLIVTGIEGGTNYWMTVEGAWNGKVWGNLLKTIKAKKFVLSNRIAEEEEGGEIITKTITEKVIQEALQLMAERHPRHFRDFTEENEDGITGDVFIQLCVLGDIIYG